MRKPIASFDYGQHKWAEACAQAVTAKFGEAATVEMAATDYEKGGCSVFIDFNALNSTRILPTEVEVTAFALGFKAALAEIPRVADGALREARQKLLGG